MSAECYLGFVLKIGTTLTIVFLPAISELLNEPLFMVDTIEELCGGS